MFVLGTTAVPGAGSWVDAASIVGGGGGELYTILARQRLAPTFGDSTVLTVNQGGTLTLTFTAPKALTLKNLVFLPTQVLSGDVDNQYVDFSTLCLLERLEVTAGTGPNVGSSFVEGGGFPLGGFALQNVVYAPTFDIALDEGDTIEMDVTYAIPNGQAALDVFFTFVDGQTDDDPSYFLSHAAPSTGVAVLPGDAATGLITVTGTPTSPGNTITVQSAYGGLFGLAANIGGVLTGASGGGASGANTWDTDVVGIENIRDEILAALQDGANNWDGEYTFAAVDTDQISVTRVLAGAIGNGDLFARSGANLTVSGASLASGTSPAASLSLAASTLDLTATHVVCALANVGSVATPPTLFFPLPPVVTGVTVGGTPVDALPSLLPTGPNQVLQAPASFTITAAAAVVVQVRAPAGALVYPGIVGKAA